MVVFSTTEVCGVGRDGYFENLYVYNLAEKEKI
jgi:hypothetical protein